VQTRERNTVVGIFTDRSGAVAAVEELRHAGFRLDQIGVVVRHDGDREAHADKVDEDVGTGLVAGTFLGGLAGAVAGGLIPGVGPVLAVGIFGGMVGCGTLGAVAGSLIGNLIALGIPEDEARHYNRQLRAGDTLVTVDTDGRDAEVFAIFGRFHASNVAASYAPAAVA
jgi:hypothetical protein